MKSRFVLNPFYLLSIIIISCLGFLVYSNTFLCSFHFDDQSSIVDNPSIRHIHNLQNIWNFWPSRFLTYLSLALNYHFSGLGVFDYHLFNTVVHVGCAVLVWWLVLLTFSTPVMKKEINPHHAKFIPLFAGLVFTAHPIQTQAVTYIVQRAASMAALFYLASLCFYIKSRLLKAKRSSSFHWRIYYAGSLITAIADMFTKETAITLPLMILLYEFSFFKTKKKFNGGYIVPFLFTFLIIPLTMFFTRSVNFHEMYRVAEAPPGISSMHYLLTQFRVMVTYVRLVFLPLSQNLDYDYPVLKNIFELPVIASLSFLMSILFCAKHLFLKYRMISFSIFWFFLTLLPESSFIPIRDVIYEHRLYLPMAGFSMFLVSGMYYLGGKNAFRAMVIALTMLIACYSVMTYQRNKVWRDDLTLWDDTVGKSPYKARDYNNRGLAYYAQGNFAQAVSDYNKAIEIDPSYAKAYYNRGLVYYAQGNFTQANVDFNKANQISPTNNADVYKNQALIYADQGNFTLAELNFKKAIEINPNDAEVYRGLGNIYYQERKFAQAITDYNKAIGIAPNDTEAYKNRIIANYQLRKRAGSP